MKVLIVEDEKLAANRLQKMLIQIDQTIQILGHLESIQQFVKWWESNSPPDLIFMDIHLADGSAFEIFKYFEIIQPVVFTTAYDQYAIQAFEVHAVDYLLKPYTRDRFKKAIERLESGSKDVGALAESVIMEREDYPERLLVQQNKKLITIAVTDIIWIEAYGDYSKLHTSATTFVSNYGISGLEEKLNPKTFLRVHRSSIINLEKVKELHKYGKSYDVTMENGDIVRVSRGYLDAIKKIML